jgi:hypothetical protein
MKGVTNMTHTYYFNTHFNIIDQKCYAGNPIAYPGLLQRYLYLAVHRDLCY